MSANVKAVFAPTKFAAVRFRQQRSGRIVNLTSDAGLGVPGASAFSAASEAVVGMTRTVARDLGKYGVTPATPYAWARGRRAPRSWRHSCAPSCCPTSTAMRSERTTAPSSSTPTRPSNAASTSGGSMTLDEIDAHAPGLLAAG